MLLINFRNTEKPVCLNLARLAQETSAKQLQVWGFSPPQWGLYTHADLRYPFN